MWNGVIDFLVVTPCCRNVTFPLLGFLALSILLIISWWIVPNVLLELPFCSVRMMLLALMCDVSREVMILDRILQITGRDVIGL